MTNEEPKTNQPSRSLADAGLVEITPDQFPERIKEAKRVAIGRLGELLQLKSDVEEQQSVAHSLGTLKRLETVLVLLGRSST